jgi:hypothetical protein
MDAPSHLSEFRTIRYAVRVLSSRSTDLSFFDVPSSGRRRTVQKLTVLLMLVMVLPAAVAEQALANCRLVANNPARLACYDKAIAVLNAADAPAVKPAADKRVEDRGPRRGRAPTISRIERGRGDFRTFYLNDGRVWRETLRGDVGFAAGQPIKVRKTWYGSYRLEAGDDTTMVSRVR